MKWNYICKEEVMFPDEKDCRNGTYMVYDQDTFDYLVNNKEWCYINHAMEERDYILNYLDNMLESNDGSFIFIPCYEVATRIETYFEE